LFAVNEYGFLEALQRKVVREGGETRITGELFYLTADDEEDTYITEATVPRKWTKVCSSRCLFVSKGAFEADTKW